MMYAMMMISIVEGCVEEINLGNGYSRSIKKSFVSAGKNLFDIATKNPRNILTTFPSYCLIK